MTEADGAPAVDSRMGGWTGVGHNAITVGQTWPPQTARITADQLARYFQCIGRTDAPGPHTTVPAFMLNELRVLKSHMKLPPGVLHAQEELHLIAPAHADEELTIQVSLQDKYVRKGKRFVAVAQVVRRAADGAPIMKVLHTLYWPC
jgi:hypothetical protein